MIAAVVLALQSVEAMRDHRRLLVVVAPDARDPQRVRQFDALRGQDAALAERDVTVIAITGDRVNGATDTASTLRQRWHLAPARFAALLIGKDGHVARRSAEPIPVAEVIATIDAMPMRRAGLR